jgi:beta-lactam-binding protein with PASTA domain
MPEVTVPNLVGLTESDAQARLSDAGLTVGATTKVASDKPSGNVLSTTPAAGTSANAGDPVNLELSSGPAQASSAPVQIVVPSIVGLTQSDAEAKLTDAGLTVGATTKVANDKPSGNVLSTTPAAGTAVKAGDPVSLELSSGPAQASSAPVQIVVPSIVGLTQSDAEAKLTDAGLTVGATTKVASDKPSGNVLSTTPAAGTAVKAGDLVSLELSSGPAQVSNGSGQVAVPYLVGLTRPAAEALLQNAGLTVGAIKKQHSNSVPAGGISSAGLAEGALVKAGTPVDLEISEGPETNWTYYLPLGLFGALGLMILCIIVYAITQTDQSFLKNLAKPEVARGLITFLIAITTVGIAIILAVSTLVLSEGDAGDKRFDRGKQVLTTLIGVLGTIVGFYFGSERESTQQRQPQTEQSQTEATKITTTSLPDGMVNKAYQAVMQAAGLTPPLKWSVDPPLPAGLKLDDTTGTIEGTPTRTVPKTSYKFTVTDSAAKASASARLDLEIE